MKKFVAMLAVGLAVAGTTFAQNAPQQDRRNNENNRYGQEHRDRKDKDKFQGREGRQGREQGWGNVSPEERATRRTEMLSQKLDLSSKQKKKLQDLNLKHAQQMQSLRGQFANNGNNGRNENQWQEMKRLQTDWDKEFKGIVSKKQYAKYEEQRQQMQANRGHRSGRDGENGARFRRQNNG